MIGTGNGVAALLLVLLLVVSVSSQTPSGKPRVLRGVASPDMTATVVSVKPIVHARNAQQVESATPAVSGGSGLARFGRWTLVAQDDSTKLAAMADDGRVVHLRLMDAVDGHDRFHPAFKNKNKKPDIEAIVRVRASASVVRRLGGNPGRARFIPVYLLFGSGSIQGVRDRVGLIVPQLPLSSSFVRVATATGLYDALRAAVELAGRSGQLNLEAATSVNGGSTVRLYNRGNSGPDSVTGSIDLATRDLLEYFVAAAADSKAPFRVPLGNPLHYDLGSSDGFAVSIGEAIALPARPAFGNTGAVLLAGIAEASANAIDDGVTSGTVLGLQLESDRRLLFTAVLHNGKPSGLKIEGLAVTSIRSLGTGRSRRVVMRIIGVVDTDSTDPGVPSDLVEIELTYRYG